MLYEGETVREVIGKALKQDNRRTNLRRRCMSLLPRIDQVDRKLSTHMQELARLNKLLDQANRESGANLRGLIGDTAAAVSGIRRARGALNVLRNVLRGRFDRRALDAFGEIFDVYRDVKQVWSDFERSAKDLDIWVDLQNQITKTGDAGRIAYDALKSFESQYQNMGCHELANPDTGPAMSMRRQKPSKFA